MKICIFTSTRADFGLLLPLIKKIKEQPKFEVRLLVTGTHLSEEHGYTYKEIQDHGLVAYYKVNLDMHETPAGHISIFGDSVHAYIKAFENDKPDLVVVLGDRYEALSFAIVANAMSIPICHLHGGEITSGALDDGYRHCITKLSDLHFTVSETCRRRVIRMGEHPDRVFNVGSLALDNIGSIKFMPPSELATSLKTKLNEKYALVTYHPETLCLENDRYYVPLMLSALGRLIEKENFSVVITRSNADQGNSWIHEQMEEFSEKYESAVTYVNSVGMVRYLSLLKNSQFMIGNSSSGIYEAPALGIPTINFGDRQKGRERAASIIDLCKNSANTSLNEEMLEKIDQAIVKSAAMKESLHGKNISLFGRGNTSLLICETLIKYSEQKFKKKEFYEELGKV